MYISYTNYMIVQRKMWTNKLVEALLQKHGALIVAVLIDRKSPTKIGCSSQKQEGRLKKNIQPTASVVADVLAKRIRLQTRLKKGVAKKHKLFAKGDSTSKRHPSGIILNVACCKLLDV